MDYLLDVPDKYTYDQWITVIVKDPRCSTLERSLYSAVPNEPSVGLTYFAARAALTNYLDKARERRNKTITSRFEQGLEAGDVKLAPDVVVMREKGELKEYSIHKGYLCESKDEKPVIAIESAASVLSYVYTPLEKTPIEEKLKSNFQESTLSFKTGIPQVQKSILVADTLWENNKVVSNVGAILDKVVDNRAKKIILKVASTISQEAVKNAKITSSRDAVDYVTTKVFEQGITVKVNGVLKDPRPKEFCPPVLLSTEIATMYKLISRHRSVRGEDSAKLSPMTSGYYYANMSNASYATFWKVADIIHMLRLLQCTSVYFSHQPKSQIMASLVKSKFVVYVFSGGRVSKIPQGVIQPGVYKVNSRPNAKQMLIYLSPEYTTCPTVLKNGDIRMDNDIVAEAKDQLTEHGHIMSHQFIHETWFEDDNFSVIPSVHVHAGSIIVTNSAVGSPLKQDQLVQRVIDATISKTWYPITRSRFLEYDSSKYAYINLALLNGMCMSKIEKDSQVSESESNKWGKIQFDDELDDYDPHPVPDKDVTENIRNMGRYPKYQRAASQIAYAPEEDEGYEDQNESEEPKNEDVENAKEDDGRVDVGSGDYDDEIDYN